MATNRKNNKKTIYHVKKGAHSAAHNFLSAFGLFIVVILFAVFFILYQWKNFEIDRNLREIDQINNQIHSLNAQKIRLETEKNLLIKRVPDRAKQILNMEEEINNQKSITLNAEKLAYYEKKDKNSTE